MNDVNSLLIKETMSSLEISELTGKRHAHVMEAIRTMESAWEKVTGSKFNLNYRFRDIPNGGYKKDPYYELTKAESLYIAAKFENETRAKLALAWEKLDNEKIKRTSSSSAYINALEALICSERERMRLLNENDKLKGVSGIHNIISSLKEECCHE